MSKKSNKNYDLTIQGYLLSNGSFYFTLSPAFYFSHQLFVNAGKERADPYNNFLWTSENKPLPIDFAVNFAQSLKKKGSKSYRK